MMSWDVEVDCTRREIAGDEPGQNTDFEADGPPTFQQARDGPFSFGMYKAPADEQSLWHA